MLFIWQFLSGIGFTPEFETGLDFAADGTLYAIIQGFDEVSPNNFEEVSSHLYTIDPLTGSATDLGVIEGDQTWDAVTLVIDDGVESCIADLTGDVNGSAFVFELLFSALRLGLWAAGIEGGQEV